MKQVHIGKEIKRVLDERGLSIAEFSRRINKSRENSYSIFRRKSIDTALLQTIGKVLEFDFFTLYVNSDTGNDELTRLKEENRLLKELNTLLKKNKK